MIHIEDDKYLLDKKENIIWDRKETALPNVPALSSLFEGIYHLAYTTRDIELKKFKENEWSMGTTILCELDVGLLYNYFMWFSISLNNYLKLIAIIDLSNQNSWTQEAFSDNEIKKQINNHCREYVQAIIPDIYKWRNKVGAHFSLTAPYPKDNILSMINSVLSVEYSSPYYSTSTAVFNTKYTKGQTNNIPSWSLSKTYDQLTTRFFSSHRVMGFLEYFNYENKPEHQQEDVKSFRTFCKKAELSKVFNKKKTTLFLDRGIKLLKENKYKKAIHQFNKSILNANAHTHAWHNLALCYANLGRFNYEKLIYEYLFHHKISTDHTQFRYGRLLCIHFSKIAEGIKFLEAIPKDSEYKKESLQGIKFFTKLSKY